MFAKLKALLFEIFEIFTYMKLMLAHYASQFMQQIRMKLILLQFHHRSNV